MKKYYIITTRWLLLIVVLLSFSSFFYFHLYDYLNLATLKKYQTILFHWTHHYYFQTIVIYFFFYILAVSCAFPSTFLLTMIGGFLFGPMAFLFAVLSLCIGSSIFFLAVRFAFHDWFLKKSGDWIKKMEKGFLKNSFSYLLILRLIPVFPFWIINIVAALLMVRLPIFVSATLIGVVPTTLVYTFLGNGLHQFLQ